MTTPRWILWIRGETTDEVRSALAGAGIELTGMGHGVGLDVDRYSAYVVAATAEEAVRLAQTAVADLPVYVDASSVKAADES